MSNGKNRKKQNYCSREVYFLNNGLKRQKYRAFVLFQETPCSLLHQLNNYLLILLKSSIFQQVQHMGTSKNWILINFIEKPFFNQFMSVFAMKF